MSKKVNARGIAVVSARIVTGVVAVAAIAACVSAAVVVNWPTSQITPPAVDVQPEQTRQERVCPGPLLSLGEDVSAATVAPSVGAAAVTAGTGAGGVAPNLVPIAAPGNPRSAEDGTPVAVVADPGTAAAGSLSAAQSQSVQTSNLRGFAAITCVEASQDSWLVGGGTKVGNTTLILLTNPGDVAATVNLAIFSENGSVQAAGTGGVLVGAHSQRMLPLSGFAPELQSPVVHVTSTGGRVAASLQQSVTQGLNPTGVEWIAQSAPPAPSQTIPGVRLQEGSDAGGAGETDRSPGMVRVFVPGAQQASVSVNVRNETGGPGAAFRTFLNPGVVTDLSLAGLPAGVFTITVESDVPVVAAARSLTGPQQQPTDFAWYTATAPLPEDSVFSVATGPSPVLHLTNPEQIDAQVTLRGGAAENSFTVPGGSGVAMPLTAGTTVTMTGSRGLYGSIDYSGDGQLSSYPLLPPGPLDTAVTVYTR